jgi:integrase
MMETASHTRFLTVPTTSSSRCNAPRSSAIPTFAIWKATEDKRITLHEQTAIKLLILLAPRKRALLGMRWEDMDDAVNPTLWVTPFEGTKSEKTAKRRTYLTPLPALAQRLLKRLPGPRTGYVFPSKVRGDGEVLTLTIGTPLK